MLWMSLQCIQHTCVGELRLIKSSALLLLQHLQRVVVVLSIFQKDIQLLFALPAKTENYKDVQANVNLLRMVLTARVHLYWCESESESDIVPNVNEMNFCSLFETTISLCNSSDG